MASAKDENCISPYRRLLLDMSMELSNKDLERLIYAVGDHLPRRLTENIESGLKLFEALEQDVHIGPQNLTLLYDGFKTIGRVDLAQRIQFFPRKLHRADETDDRRERIETDGGRDGSDTEPKGSDLSYTGARKDGRDDMVTDGVGDGSDPEPKGSDLPYTGARKAAADEHVMTFRSVVDQPHPANPRSTSTGLSGGDADGRTAEHLVAVRSDASLTVTNNGSSLESARGPCSAPSRDFVHKSSARLQPDPAVGPAPPQYVDFLLHEEYVVKILGGKHFKTPDGEFVEMKSGTQYAIHVKNCRAYGCYVDISIDGYDVGRWALRGGEEISIERPAYEAKKFTFYRVKTAPKEAGIESGRPENGVVKCVFTPEAFLNIPVITSDSSQPLNVSIPPSATVGELKRKLQHQMEVMDDPYQVLAKSDKVLTNGTRLRGILEKPTDLRLIDAEITITVTAEASSSFPFPISVHPGKVKVHYLMEQIEGKIQVPIRDQKLYHEGNLLSASPSSYLPDKLICSPRPAVNVIIPEYIHITVKDQSGDSHSVKVDKEKNLEAVMEEIPSSSDLQENEEATFAFNGKQLFPSKDEGTLASLGICSGSKLELTVRILYIEVEVFFSDNSSSVIVKCDPQETFRDLVEKILKRRNSRKYRLTFAIDGREFDPDQDKGPLQDYGVTHGRTLRVTRHPTSVSIGARILNRFKNLGAPDSGAVHGRMLRGKSRSISVSTGDRILDRPQMLGAVAFYNDPSSPETEKCNSSKTSKINVEYGKLLFQGKGQFLGHCGDVFMVAGSHSGDEKRQFWGHCGKDDELTVGTSRWKEDQSCGFSGIFDGRTNVVKPDPAWRSGGTTLQGHSTQQFTTAEPIRVDHSRRVELVLRLVARDGEKDLEFPKGECKPMSTLTPPPVQE